MRWFIAYLIGTALVVWLFDGVPIPMLSERPMQPDARLPTFRQAVADHDELKRAKRDGRLVEDADERALRQAVLHAAERLEASPCRGQLRQELSVAIGAFFKARMTAAMTDRPPAERIRVNGRVIAATSELDASVDAIITAAIMERVMRVEDLPTQALRASYLGHQLQENHKDLPDELRQFRCEGTPNAQR